MTVSAAVLMAAPIAGTTISQTVNAAPTNTSQVGKSSKLSVNSLEHITLFQEKFID